jgi:hypothetical protein
MIAESGAEANPAPDTESPVPNHRRPRHLAAAGDHAAA